MEYLACSRKEEWMDHESNGKKGNGNNGGSDYDW